MKVICAINGHAETVFEEMKSLLLLCMSLVVDFVFLGGTNSVMVNWGLILYSVFRQILGNLRTTTKFTTTTSVDWERTGTRTSVSAGKRKLKMQSIG